LDVAAPDFTVIEWAVNDGNTDEFKPYYEQVTRQLLYSEKRPGLMLMMMMNNKGINAQERHAAIGSYYGVPMASFRDAVWPEIQSGRFAWSDLYADVVHPNDAGHALVAKFITTRLDSIYTKVQNEELVTETNPEQKPALIMPEIHKDGRTLTADGAYPTAPVMSGWTADYVNTTDWGTLFGKGWKTSTPGSTITFTTEACRSIAVVYRMPNQEGSGIVDITVDGGNPTRLSRYDSSSGGGGLQPTFLQLLTNGGLQAHTVTFTLVNVPGNMEFAINGLLTADRE
jgi:hypothetical protein